MAYDLDQMISQEGIMFKLLDKVERGGAPASLDIETLMKELQPLGLYYTMNCTKSGKDLKDEPCFGFCDYNVRKEIILHAIDLTIYNGEQGLIIGLKPEILKGMNNGDSEDYVSKILDICVPFIKDPANYGRYEREALRMPKK